MDELITTKTARQLLGVTPDTLRSWAKKGKIRASRTPSNHRLYYKQDILRIAGLIVPDKKKKKIVYCRVSSSKQKDDLERQTSSLGLLYPEHQFITDIGSGINWKRKGLQTILERALQGDIDEVVVAHRDRLARFAFELIQYLFELTGVKLIVLGQDNDEAGHNELADDILSIIHIYSCRNMGRRRYKNKKDKDVPDKGAKIST